MPVDIQAYIYDLSRELNIDVHGVPGNELELIALVRNCPLLYDKRKEDFKNEEKRESAWEAIATVFHCPTPDVKNRWKSLREQYGRITRIDGERNETEKLKASQWEFLDDMKFMDEHILRRSRKFRKVYPGSETAETESNADTSNAEHDEDKFRLDWVDESTPNDQHPVLKLIQLVKKCPALYDKSNYDNRDVVKRNAAWSSISKKVGKTVGECQARWKSLRERYTRERKAHLADPTRMRWQFYDELLFLDNHVRRRNRSNTFRDAPKPDYTTIIKTSKDSDLVANSNISADSHHFPMFHQIQKMEFIDTNEQSIQSEGSVGPLLNSHMSEILPQSKSGNSSQTLTDEDDLFGQSITAELRRMKNRRKKMKLKASIFRVLCEVESDTD